MDRDNLARLNSYQIAGLAIFSSTAAALAVYLFVRMRRDSAFLPLGTRQSGVTEGSPGPASPASIPRHFSEDVIVPGFTQTGADIAQEDAGQGHSSEGV